MSWRERLRWPRSRREDVGPTVARTPFVLLERRDLSPRGSALLAQLARRYTVISVPNRQRYSFRVGVADAERGVDPARHLADILADLDAEWEEHFTWPVPMPGRN